MKWAVGVTTVHRRVEAELPITLSALDRAGFEDLTLFLDGDGFGDVHGRQTVYRALSSAFANWSLGLRHLIVTYPLADRYAMFQDDLQTVRNLRQYLETFYPKDGFLNLYTVPENAALRPSGDGWYKSNQKGRGALALVFDRAAVIDLLANRKFVEHPFTVEGTIGIDGIVMTAMAEAGRREYVHRPSLVQHIGDKTTLRKHRAIAHPKASNFPGVGFDAMSLLGETPAEPGPVVVAPSGPAFTEEVDDGMGGGSDDCAEQEGDSPPENADVDS